MLDHRFIVNFPFKCMKSYGPILPGPCAVGIHTRPLVVMQNWAAVVCFWATATNGQKCGTGKDSADKLVVGTGRG